MKIISAATQRFLVSANGLKRFLGHRGLIAMERLMGMLLEGFSAYFAELAQEWH